MGSQPTCFAGMGAQPTCFAGEGEFTPPETVHTPFNNFLDAPALYAIQLQSFGEFGVYRRLRQGSYTAMGDWPSL